MRQDIANPVRSYKVFFRYTLVLILLYALPVVSQEPALMRARVAQKAERTAEEENFSNRLENNNRRFLRELSGMKESLGLSDAETDFLAENRASTIQLMAAMEFDADMDQGFLKAAVGNLMENLEVSLTDRYLAVETLDQPATAATSSESFMNMQDPLYLEDCTEIELTFGITNSDQLSADQPVNPLLIEAIQFAIREANIVLEQLKFPMLIETVHISATTNGRHGTYSNHYTGTAVDISRINRKRMLLAEGDERRLIYELQEAFNKHPHIRENFGPFIKYKYTVEDRTWRYNHPVSGHDTHIHISVRQ